MSVIRVVVVAGDDPMGCLTFTWLRKIKLKGVKLMTNELPCSFFPSLPPPLLYNYYRVPVVQHFS